MGRRKRLPRDPFPLSVQSLLTNGRGYAEHEGRGLEVFDALPGEKINARYLFGRRFRGKVETLEVFNCPHFGMCSACSLQHATTGAQIEFKQQWMLDQLYAHDGLEPAEVLAPLQGATWHYRRKARLSVRNVPAKGRVLVGFRERDGRFVTDMSQCEILPQRISQRLPDLSGLLSELDAAAKIPQLELACGDDAYALVLRHLEPLSPADRERLERFSAASGLDFYLQPGGPETVESLLPEAGELSYGLPAFGLELRFHPMDFVQVNASLNELMIQQALALLAPERGDHVLDLFCGLGNFSLPIAQHCASVLGLEGDPDLVRRAGDNARLNKLTNVEFRQADLYDSESGVLDGISADRVLLDPPRSGAGPLLAAVARSGATRIVYVSCNPVTMAADAHTLVESLGFRLVSAGVMDMFPHTAHVESMALFER
jgi:23S rRNA (uracil1939-C5)-methyltransferase